MELDLKLDLIVPEDARTAEIQESQEIREEPVDSLLRLTYIAIIKHETMEQETGEVF